MFYIDTVSQNSLDSISNASRFRSSFTRQTGVETSKNDSIGIGLRINFRKGILPTCTSILPCRTRAKLRQTRTRNTGCNHADEGNIRIPRGTRTPTPPRSCSLWRFWESGFVDILKTIQASVSLKQIYIRP